MTSIGDGMELLRACAAEREQRGRAHVDLGPVLERLAARGWTAERLVKNDLAEPAGVAGRDYGYASFWATIARLAEEMRRLELPPIFIKCVREYAYCDSNVDLLVPRKRLRAVGRALTERDWQRPTPWDTFEQLLIEREKLKLPSTDSALLAAHLYGGVSWRYQSDIGLLRRDSADVNPQQLVERPIADFDAAAGAGGATIWLPDDASEFVMQAAHIAFENYRVTVGEALHFQLLRMRAADAWEPARALAAEYGCLEALDLLDRESLRICRRLEDLDPADYPRTLPFAAVAPAFRERAAVLFRARRPVMAFVEPATAGAVWLAVSVVRRFRRFRRGVEDYRH